MTFGTLAWLHDSVASHPAKTMRNLAGALSGTPTITHANAATPTTRGGGYGVVAGGDLLVTTTGTLGYSIAAGTALVTGTFATSQGVYGVYNDAAVTGSVGARNATNPRIDLICVRVRDTDTDATGAEDAGAVVVAGTAAASPVAPSIPSSLGSLLVLSEVLVPSAAAGTALTFTDRRRYASALGGIQRVTSATRPTTSALWEGLWIDESDTDRLLRYSGSAFDIINEPKQTFSMGFSQGSAAVVCSTTSASTWYRRSRNEFHMVGHGTVTDASAVTGGGQGGQPLYFAFPGSMVLPDLTAVYGTLNYFDNTTAWYFGVANGETTTYCSFAAHNAASKLGTVPSFTVANGDIFHVELTGAYV